MAANTFATEFLTYIEAIQKIRALVALFHDAKSVQGFHIDVISTLEGVQLNSDFGVRGPWSALENEVARVSDIAELGLESFTVEFKSESKPWLSVKYERANPLFPILRIDNVNQCKDRIDFYKKLKASFLLMAQPDAISRSMPEPLQLITRVQSQSIEELKSTVSQLSVFVADQIKRNEQHIRSITETMQASHDKRLDELESRHAKRNEEVNARERIIENRERDLNSHENRIVRRQLLEKVDAVLAEQKTIDLSSETRKKVRPIFIACCLGMAAGTAIEITGLVFFYRAGAEYWHSIPLLLTGMLLFASTLIYFLRWSSLWLARHADPEMQNMQFKKDFIRASWIAELFLEGNQPERSPFPPYLLEQFSRNLFTSSSPQIPDHPMDDFLRWSKRFRKLKLGSMAFELNEDKQGEEASK